jgi:nucleotide-binding universal stress UspA family protein
MAATIERILVPVDFSPCSRAALDYAVELAEQTRASVDVLHVAEPRYAGPPEALLLAPDAAGGQAWGQPRADMFHELEGFLGPARRRVRNVRVEEGLPGDAIDAVARRGSYDLIVMGTHGRGGLTRLVVGSVAESVMRRATIPVLTLRLPKREHRERVPL